MAKALLLVPSCRDPDPVRAISTVRWGWGWGIVEAPPPRSYLTLFPSTPPPSLSIFGQGFLMSFRLDLNALIFLLLPPRC